MNRRSFLCAIVSAIVLGSFLFAIDTAFADEPKSAALIQTLPADGVWTEFNVIVKIEGRELTPKWAVRSVGQAFQGGKQCRFIEMEQSSDQDNFQKKIWRLLVPEDEFGEGKDPLSKAVRRWVKVNDNAAESVDSLELKDPIIAMLLAGPKQNVKSEDAKEKVSWQQGELECSIISGGNDVALAGNKLSISHRVFRHKDVPFGLAGLHQDLMASFGGKNETLSIKMSLRDHGKDAKAKLPDLVP